MDSLHILPGKGLSGHFFLDMSLLKAIKKLRNFSIKLPCINIIEETYSKRIIIEIPDTSLKLIFDEQYQKLIIIEIDCRNPSEYKLPIMYQSKMYTNYSEILKDLDSSYKPLQTSNNKLIEQRLGMSILSEENRLLKLFIHKNNSLPLHRNKLKARVYQIRPFDKIVLINVSGKEEDLSWNLFPEAVIDLLGPPDYVRYKTIENYSDYFYSYVTDGLDLLFSSENHQLYKIIMHTNMLEDILFNEYERCNFVIFANEGEITPMTNFLQIKDMFDNAPVEVGVRKHGHGYKPTQYFKCNGILFEVLHTGFIASVSLSYNEFSMQNILCPK